jgi:ubiquinone/menaquinone biosynthesis C-methylase UbiE
MAALADLPRDEVAADLERLREMDAARAVMAERYFQTHAADWDSIRSLHVSEAEVEAMLLEAVGTAQVEDLLDVGTGTGRILSLLASLAARAVGIDRSAAMLGAARPAFVGPQFRHVHLRQGDMYHLPLASDSIDLAVFHQVLHFADDPGRALREVARVIRPSGRILVVDFAPHTLEFLREHHAHRRLGFTTDDLRAWAQSTGLLVREVARRAGTPLTVVLWELHPIASAPSHT